LQRLQKSYLSLLEKRNSKKEKRGQALLARPPPFRPSFPLPSPVRGRPPRSTRRRPRGGRTSASWTRRWPTDLPRSGQHPARLDAILSPPAPSVLLRSRAQPQRPPRPHCRPALRRSPQAALVALSLRQDNRRARLRRGKPLRTLYRGENPPRTLNLSPEFARTRRRAPPRRNLPVSAPFCLFFSALGSE